MELTVLSIGDRVELISIKEIVVQARRDGRLIPVSLGDKGEVIATSADGLVEVMFGNVVILCHQNMLNRVEVKLKNHERWPTKARIRPFGGNRWMVMFPGSECTGFTLPTFREACDSASYLTWRETRQGKRYFQASL